MLYTCRRVKRCESFVLGGARRRVSFFVSSRRRHTRFDCDWSSDVCSSDLLTIAENVALGLDSAALAGIDDRVSEVSRAYGLPLDPKREVWRLSVGERQRIEIVRRSEERRVGEESRSRGSPYH